MASGNIRRSSRRSSSLSSSPSISSSLSSGSISDSHSPITTAAPPTPLRYFGIPFSWEQFPGIPKKNHHKKTDSSHYLLPLPPSSTSRKSFGKETTPMIKNHSTSESFRKDPFFAAFVECSKDDEFGNRDFRKPSSKSPDLFGFVSMYTSCKRTCAVSESLVYLPRSRANYF